jgi:hypothetical protein
VKVRVTIEATWDCPGDGMRAAATVTRKVEAVAEGPAGLPEPTAQAAAMIGAVCEAQRLFMAHGKPEEAEEGVSPDV